MASLSVVRSTTIAFTTSRDPTKDAVFVDSGETDRSLIALGNPACPNKFAKRPAGEREAALLFLWFAAI